MIPAPFDYVAPTTLDEAMSLLAQNPGARPTASDTLTCRSSRRTCGCTHLTLTTGGPVSVRANGVELKLNSHTLEPT